MSDLSGRQFNGYELRKPIGKGGIGHVYYSIQTNLKREVAIKVINPEKSNDPVSKKRFENEAQLLASLNNLHIATIYDYFYNAEIDKYFIVMEYMKGGTLEEQLAQLKGNFMSLNDVRHIIQQAANALDYAHTRQPEVIHRDIKPANMMFNENTILKLTDFGLAKRIGTSLGTHTDAHMGTAAYMAPDAGNGGFDKFSDIYSLGIVLYEMLVGAPPFIGNDGIKTISMHYFSEIPLPTSKRNDLPIGVDLVIQKVLAKKKDERYQTAGELARAFAQAIGMDQREQQEPRRTIDYNLMQAEDLIDKVEKSRQDPLLYEFLRWKYGKYRLLEREQYVYPVVVYPAPKEQWQNPNSVLLPLEIDADGRKDDYIINDPSYRELRGKLDSRLIEGSDAENRVTYEMRGLLTDGELKLRCGKGTYWDGLDTSDILEWEILYNWFKAPPKNENDFEPFDRKLSLRKELHRQVTDPVHNGSGRCSTIAISTLIAFKDEEQDEIRRYLLVRLRSKAVAVHRDLYHVFPSGMFQSSVHDHNTEFSVIHNFYREYLEELFSMPDLRKEDVAHDARYFYGEHPLIYLRNLIDSGEAKLYLTGVAVSLLNFRPEICTLLLVNTEKWWPYHARTRDEMREFKFTPIEMQSLAEAQSSGQDTKLRVPYTEDDKVLLNNWPIKPGDMVPPGAGALWLGIDVIRELQNTTSW